ncbi:MAG: EAL domain-containing protein [Betaproteobacteria bacterium]|nr:EAL domain-containing protein [Betaproteobacteria bacterium]
MRERNEAALDGGDITAEQLRDMLQLQRALLDAATGLEPAQARIDRACRLFEQAVPGAVASVMLLDAQGLLQVFSAPSIPPAIIRELNDLTPGPGAGSCGNVIYRQEPVFVSDTLSDPRWEELRPLAVDHQLKACWSTPIRNAQHQIVGTFALTSFEHGLPRAFERQLLELGASVLGLLLQQQREEVARQAQEADTRRLALVASQTTNGVLILDPQGSIVWVNQGFQALSGYPADDLIGRTPAEVLQGPQSDPKTAQALRAAVRAGQCFDGAIVNYTRLGNPYWVQIALSPIHRADGSLEGFISVETDITALRRLTEFNALHAAVNQVVASCDDATILLQSICDLAARNAHLELAWIGKPDDAGRFAFLAHSGAASGYLDDLLISADPQLPEGQGSSARAWREGRAYYNTSFAATAFLAPWHARAREFGLQASAAQPIFRAGAIWAVLNVYHAQSDVFDAPLQVLLEELARDISRGLDRIDLLTRERELAAAQQQLSEQLYQEKELAQITLASIGDAVITTDVSGRVTFLNPIAERLTGWASSLAVGRPVADILRLVHESTGEAVVNPVDVVLQTGKTVELANHTVLIARDGARSNIEDSAAPISTQDGTLQGCVLVFRDITEKYEAQQRLKWQATHDPLTGLPNRYALELHLRAGIERARRGGTAIAVGLLDLDDFKPLNDAHGHAMGDRLLQQLAQRLQARLRASDMLARLGGDELVVVFEDMAETADPQSLESALARLHEAVETPFELAPGVQVELGMSMGIATYPQDATDGDGLLRQADAAMYASKSNKFTRSHWWRFAASDVSLRTDDDPIDAYGRIASELLSKAHEHWAGMGDAFIEAFYARLAQQPRAARILGFLAPGELVHLKERQAHHLQRITAADLRDAEHDAIGTHLGRVHATIGVDASDVIAAMSRYGELLHAATQKLPWRTDARLVLNTILQARLARELQAQSLGRDQIEQGRLAHLADLETHMQGWIQSGDFAEHLVQYLITLPCVTGVAIGRPDATDEYVLEFAAGNAAPYVDEMRRHGVRLGLHPAGHGKRGKRGPSQRAWLTGHIQVCSSEVLEAESDVVAAIATRLGIRSSAAIPILDAQACPMMLLTLLGAYPGQFESPSMRMWLESLQHLATPVFQRLERGIHAAPIDAGTRQHLHDLLFADNVEMVVQPIVTLATGAVDKVEALARLRDQGRLLPPGEFLPAFGHQELQVLFHKGLRQILQWLVRWDAQGLHIDASINLPPSVLVARDCPRWIEEELKATGLSPSRLYLELLETEDEAFDTQRRDAAVTQLAALGVRLVMDDLGAGYSSLQRLRTLPFHTVKIDQNLVKHAQADAKQTVPFIGSLVRMAQTLGLSVVVEGLESPVLVDMACGLGAEYGQGFALSRPFAPDALAQWMAQRQWPAGPSGPEPAPGPHAAVCGE